MSAPNDPVEPDPAELQQQLQLLRGEHRELDDTIERLTLAPPDDQLAIRRLKKRKLALKDSIVMIERQLDPDEYA